MDETFSTNIEQKKYKKVPPEGGWGYIIAISIFVIMSLHHGPQASFGVLFVDFLESVEASTTSINLVYSLYNISFSISGLFANILFKTFSCRQVALVGAVLYSTGHFLTIFVSSVTYLYITYAILPGFGFGLILPAVFTCFNGFFSQKRSRMMLVSSPFVGLSFMCYPIMIYALMEHYGFRGALAVLAGITFHMILVATSLLDAKDHQVYVEIISPTDLELASPLLRLKHEENADESNYSDKQKNIFEEMLKTTFLYKIINFFDLTLMKDFSYMNLVIGISLVDYSLVAFIALQPLYLLSIGWTKAEASICTSIIGAAEIISKICLTLLTFFYPIRSRYIFLIGAACTAIGRICFMLSTSQVAVFLTSAVLGFFKPWMFAVLSLVFAEHVPLNRFPAAYGLFMFLQGISYMILGPVVGYVRDATGSYVTAFHVLTFFLIVCVLLWLGELIWTKMKQSNHLYTK